MLVCGQMESANPPETGIETHFEQPTVTSGHSIGRVVVVRDPATHRRVLFRNCDNHEKGWMHRRALSAHLNGAVLTVEAYNCGTPRCKIV
jgi:hypothetical protein